MITYTLSIPAFASHALRGVPASSALTPFRRMRVREARPLRDCVVVDTLAIPALLGSALLRGGARRALWQLVVREASVPRNCSVEYATTVPALLRSTLLSGFAPRAFRKLGRRFEALFHGRVNGIDTPVVPANLALTLKREATLRALRQGVREAEVYRILRGPNAPSVPALVR